MNKPHDLLVFRSLGLALIVLFMATFDGCGDGSDAFDSGSGQALVSLTDAAGDFLSYTVDVTSLTLTKRDDNVVSTVPRQTRVDFAQLTDLSELLTAATVPTGTYKSVTLQLDYRNADIEVDDGSGNAVPVTAVQDRAGKPVTTLTVTLQLDEQHPLVITRGLASQLQLDFDLAASNEVNMTGPVVTVDPVLAASLSFDSSKPHRLRGPLTAVDTGASTFSIDLRPFHLLGGDFGRVTIGVNDDTVFEIDQQDYTGAGGLAQLKTEPNLTATVALVTPDPGTGRLVASEVYAGSSARFGTSDVVTGNIIARSDDQLTVRGATLERAQGSLTFHDTVTVSVGSATKVTRQRFAGTDLTTDALSVGQRITAFGTWSDGSKTLDATDPTKGPVRMLITQLNGNAVAAPAGQTLTLALNQINGRRIGLFDFTGTGTPNADPTHYVVDVADGISLAGIQANTPLRARGFVAPFGQASTTDDFDADTVIDVDKGPADLVVHWPRADGVTAPFSSFTTSGMVLDLSHSGAVHDVVRSGVDTSLAISATPTVTAKDPANGLFILGYHGVIQVYTTLAGYQGAVQARLGSGAVARAFTAHGTYDDDSATLLADSLSLLLE